MSETSPKHYDLLTLEKQKSMSTSDLIEHWLDESIAQMERSRPSSSTTKDADVSLRREIALRVASDIRTSGESQPYLSSDFYARTQTLLLLRILDRLDDIAHSVSNIDFSTDHTPGR